MLFKLGIKYLLVGFIVLLGTGRMVLSLDENLSFEEHMQLKDEMIEQHKQSKEEIRTYNVEQREKVRAEMTRSPQTKRETQVIVEKVKKEKQGSYLRWLTYVLLVLFAGGVWLATRQKANT